MPSEHFRVVDPLENLRLRVTLRKVGIPYFAQSNVEGNEIGQTVQATISWQEKVLGPRDIINYLQHKESSSKSKKSVKKAHLMQDMTVVQVCMGMIMLQQQLQHSKPGLSQRQQFERLRKMEENNEDVCHILQPMMIFTLVDAELIDMPEAGDSKLTNCTAAPPHPGTLETTGRKDYKTFHIMAGMELPLNDQSNTPQSKLVEELTKQDSFFEQRLCSIKIFNSGEVEISPGLSHHAPEIDPKSAINYEPIFFASDTLRVAAEKGFRLSTWRFRSRAGSTYEYAIENVRDLLPLNEVDKLIVEERLTSKARKSAITSTLLVRQSKDVTLHVFAEIISADGFDNDQLVVAYETYLPQQWRPVQPNHREAVMGYKGETQLGTARYVRSGACAISSQTPPAQSNSMAPRWNSSFGVGWLMFFSIFACGLAVVVDYNYCFWLVPALLVIAGTIQATRVSRTASVTMPYHKNVATIPVASTVFPVVHFSHHIRIRLACSASCFEDAHALPQLLLQVRGRSFWGLPNLQGYGYVNIPTTPGVHHVEIKSWRTIGGVQDQLQDFFVGLRTSFADPSFVAVPNKQLRSLNRFGLTTVSAGSVYLRFNIVLQTPPHQQQSKQSQVPSASKQLPPLTLKRSVADILNSVRSQSLSRTSQTRKEDDQTVATPKLNRLDVQSILAKARSRREIAE